MAKLELTGMQGLIDKVQELGSKASRIENQALKAAGQPILNEAVQTSEFHDRTGKLRKGLKISNIKKDSEGKKYVLVGVDKSDISEVFYGKFHEFGERSAA